MIYVMSDIHGNEQRFLSVMRQIRLRPEDTLYILGDVVDRFPDGIRILTKIMKMPNAKMLLGNHEDMMLTAIEGDPQFCQTGTLRKCPTENRAFRHWYRNGGEVTLNALRHIRKDRRLEICARLHSLPLNIDVEAGGRKYRLVHASPVEAYDPPSSRFENLRKFAVWERWQPGSWVPDGCTMIFGHTPTCHFQNAEPWEIWRGENAVGIDCGCGYREGRLACLRLDDGAVYYSEER